MLSPFGKELANGLEMALAQFGVLVPIFVWIWFAVAKTGDLNGSDEVRARAFF